MIKKSLKRILNKINTESSKDLKETKNSKGNQDQKNDSKISKEGMEENNWNNKLKQDDENSYEEIYQVIDDWMNEEETPLFNNIEIEIINRCNGTCSFCPVNKNVDTRELKYMDEDLLKKIIDELSELNYEGTIAFHSNNEPLLDKRLVSFLEYAKEKLPNNLIYLFTNGTLLNLDKFKELVNSLDLIIIDNYNDKKEMIPPIKEVFKYCLENPELKEKVYIDMRLENQILTSRGGEANNRNEVNLLKSSCYLPYTKIVVQPDGTVPLCCCDPFAKVILGNVTDEKISDIWYGEKYTELREKLHEKEYSRKNLELCNECDVLITEIDSSTYYLNNISNKWNQLKKV